MKKLLTSLGFGLGAAAFAVASVSAATTVVVTGDTADGGENTPGWMFNRDTSTDTPFVFNTDEASIGVGSLNVLPIGANASDKFIGENFINSLVSQTESISYDFKIGAGGVDTEEEQFYMNVYANFAVSPDDKFYDCRYNVVPTVGSTSGWTTVTFDPTQSYSVTPRGGATPTPFTCPSIPADMDLQGAGSNIRAFALNLGDTSNSDQGLDGYFDNVVTVVNGEETVYDFEPTLTPGTKDDCKNGGWATFNAPQTFKNQGDCVSFMAKAKTTSYKLNSNNKNGINVPTKNGVWYEVTVEGTWTNRAGEVVDAECTNYNGAGWFNAVSGGYSPNLLDVQLDEAFVAWGACDAVDHSYTKWVQGDGTPLNLRVFDGDTNTNQQIDGWFSDNVGTLDVTVVSH